MGRYQVIRIPAPRNWGTHKIEPFSEYLTRWPEVYSNVPNEVIESWIYRHWREFQQWLPLRPLEWTYELSEVTSEEVLNVGHVGDWMDTLDYWGNELFDRPMRRNTWLGRFMLENGTTPSPIIIARAAGRWSHPREHDHLMHEPLQLIEGHLRLAYLRALIRRSHATLQPSHRVVLTTLPYE